MSKEITIITLLTHWPFRKTSPGSRIVLREYQIMLKDMYFLEIND